MMVWRRSGGTNWTNNCLVYCRMHSSFGLDSSVASTYIPICLHPIENLPAWKYVNYEITFNAWRSFRRYQLPIKIYSDVALAADRLNKLQARAGVSAPKIVDIIQPQNMLNPGSSNGWIYYTSQTVKSQLYVWGIICNQLTNWGLNKMSDIMEMAFSNPYCWMKTTVKPLI